jgi:hypothetical protein
VTQPNQFHATNTPKYVLKIVLANQLVPTPHVHENMLHTQKLCLQKPVVQTPHNYATVTRKKCKLEICAYKSITNWFQVPSGSPAHMNENPFHTMTQKKFVLAN